MLAWRVRSVRVGSSESVSSMREGVSGMWICRVWMWAQGLMALHHLTPYMEF